MTGKCQHRWQVVIGHATTGEGDREYEYQDRECSQDAVWFDEGVSVCATHAVEEYGVSEAAFR